MLSATGSVAEVRFEAEQIGFATPWHLCYTNWHANHTIEYRVTRRCGKVLFNCYRRKA